MRIFLFGNSGTQKLEDFAAMNIACYSFILQFDYFLYHSIKVGKSIIQMHAVNYKKYY